VSPERLLGVCAGWQVVAARTRGLAGRGDPDAPVQHYPAVRQEKLHGRRAGWRVVATGTRPCSITRL
jgi:hypothetical protein